MFLKDLLNYNFANQKIEVAWLSCFLNVYLTKKS